METFDQENNNNQIDENNSSSNVPQVTPGVEDSSMVKKSKKI